MTSDFNIRLANLQNSYETLKNEIGELKKFISAFETAFQGHILNLTSRINNNNDLHVSNFNKSISYLDDTSDKIKNDIKSFEKVKDNMADIYAETLGNRVSLDKMTEKTKEIEKLLEEKENKIKQQQQNIEENKQEYLLFKNSVAEINLQNLKTSQSHSNVINKHQDELDKFTSKYRLIIENFNVFHDRINSIVSTIESLHASIEKCYFNHCADINALEKKLTEYIDKKIISLPKPPERFETSPQVLEELKVLGLNIKNLVLQKNTLEINSKKQEYQINNLTQQIQSIKG